MLSDSPSLENLAECTPMTTSWLAYLASSFFRSGMMCMQLMQQYVQKSSNTTFPLSLARVSGWSVLSQAMPPSSSGARTRSCAIASPFCAACLSIVAACHRPLRQRNPRPATTMTRAGISCTRTRRHSLRRGVAVVVVCSAIGGIFCSAAQVHTREKGEQGMG